jgi:hypothetical protein
MIIGWIIVTVALYVFFIGLHMVLFLNYTIEGIAHEILCSGLHI